MRPEDLRQDELHKGRIIGDFQDAPYSISLYRRNGEFPARGLPSAQET